MSNSRYNYFIFLLGIFFLTASSSCRKDVVVNEATHNDSLTDNIRISSSAATGNFLSSAGLLKIKVNDSTYTFDASRDSIAFINMRPDSESRYFGITAINKEHTMSFGISSAGFANSNTINNVAGSQLLLIAANGDLNQQFSLSKYAAKKDFGNINLVKYHQQGVLAKGTFFTFMARDNKATSPVYRIEGTFELYFK